MIFFIFIGIPLICLSVAVYIAIKYPDKPREPDYDDLEDYEDLEDCDDVEEIYEEKLHKDYNDYYLNLHDAAMSGDKTAIKEMKEEFGDDWKDEF